MLPATPPSPTLFRCPKCGEPLSLAEKLWDMKTARFIRVYKCRCGELLWDDQSSAERS